MLYSQEDATRINEMLSTIKDLLDQKKTIPTTRGECMLLQITSNDAKQSFLQSLGTTKKILLADIASAEEIQELIMLYAHVFGEREDYPVEVPELEVINSNDQIQPELLEMLGDLGTEEESKKNADELAQQLGFPDHRPVSFNTEKFKYLTLDLWEKEHKELKDDRELLKLEWVQLAGISAMVRKTFSSEKRATKAPGILLADEVGIGKTAQIMGFIAFLLELRIADEQAKPRPPILCKCSPCAVPDR
jgi:hypothetical protein